MAEYKAGLRKAGIKPPKVEASPVNPAREYRRAPEERLVARLGLLQYDKEAPLDDTLRETKSVRINLSQHIGAPAKAVVVSGDMVSAQTVVAKAADGLSVNIHASVAGKVTDVTDKYIEISAR